MRNTKNYRPEQQNSNPYSDMGILGINIFGKGIQIFFNTSSTILGCHETMLLHKKASFPFIWRLLYIRGQTLILFHRKTQKHKPNHFMSEPT